MGILCIALEKSASGELQREIDQRQREIDFHEKVQDHLMLNPTHCVLPAQYLDRTLMALFQKGQPKSGGRRKGARDRLSTAFLEALAKDFEEFGDETIRIARLERPIEYLRIVASRAPIEFEITDLRLTEMTDDEIISFIETIRDRSRVRDSSASAEDGTSETTH